MIDPRLFRSVLGCFATGVTVVTTLSGRGKKAIPVGVTINSLTSVSLDPPLVLYCLGDKARTFESFKKSKKFAVNILTEKQEDLARHFAGARGYEWNNIAWKKSEDGLPLLDDTLAWFTCVKQRSVPAGDHMIFIGEITDLHVQRDGEAPLLYARSRYRRIRD